jgi:hypothetical protein
MKTQLTPGRQWSGMMSRTAKKVANNLGVIRGDQAGGKLKGFRSQKLEDLDAYYENRQHDKLIDWDQAVKMAAEENGTYIPVRERKPRIQVAFAKMLCQRITSKLIGQKTFPALKVEEDPETELFTKLVLKASGFRSHLLEPMRRCLASGSCFVRFYFVNGIIKIEHFLSKFCYPVFDDAGHLESITIKYVFEDPEDLDDKEKPRKKWYKLELSGTSDIEYDNPLYVESGGEPVFQEAKRVDHNLGFVQGEWLRTSEDKHSPDGYSLNEDILDFIDELNYSLSQSSTAVSYNQDPQLALSGMDVDDIEKLVRSSAKAWNMGRDGKAQFLETNLTGVETAERLRDKIRLGIQDIARIVMMDPEKMMAQAQSGKAMEILHGPMVELIDELRPMVEKYIIALLVKIIITYLILMSQGVETGLEVPPGWSPKSFNLTAVWPPIFPMTMSDLKEKLGVAVQATSASLISRETATRWLAKDFDIEDIEAELAKIAGQPILNPFGSF